MTEGEAKTKWCCGPKMVADMFLASKGYPNPNLNGRCIGSSCMAWRWDIEYNRNRKFDKPADAWGFCGLAGTP